MSTLNVLDPWKIAEAIGAIGGAGGAIATAIVAGVQINKLAATERARSTTEYIQSYDTVQKLTPLEKMETAAISMSKVRALLHDHETLKRFKRFSSTFRATKASGAPLSAELRADAKVFKEYASSVVAAINYFALAASLAKDKKIDVARFVKFLKSPLNSIRTAMVTLAEADPNIAAQLLDEEMQYLWRETDRVSGPFDHTADLETLESSADKDAPGAGQ
jgi:hypothetical protein